MSYTDNFRVSGLTVDEINQRFLDNCVVMDDKISEVASIGVSYLSRHIEMIRSSLQLLNSHLLKAESTRELALAKVGPAAPINSQGDYVVPRYGLVGYTRNLESLPLLDCLSQQSRAMAVDFSEFLCTTLSFYIVHGCSDDLFGSHLISYKAINGFVSCSLQDLLLCCQAESPGTKHVNILRAVSEAVFALADLEMTSSERLEPSLSPPPTRTVLDSQAAHSEARGLFIHFDNLYQSRRVLTSGLLENMKAYLIENPGATNALVRTAMNQQGICCTKGTINSLLGDKDHFESVSVGSYKYWRVNSNSVRPGICTGHCKVCEYYKVHIFSHALSRSESLQSIVLAEVHRLVLKRLTGPNQPWAGSIPNRSKLPSPHDWAALERAEDGDIVSNYLV